MKPHVASRQPRYEIPDRPPPQSFDHSLRWWVWSRHTPGKKYLCQLDSFNVNGLCDCESFRFKLGKILAQGITPEMAVAQRLVKLKERQRPSDALRCPHLIDAWMAFAEATARAITDAEAHASRPPS